MMMIFMMNAKRKKNAGVGAAAAALCHEMTMMMKFPAFIMIMAMIMMNH